MLALSTKEIFIAQHSIDFRKGADGLLAECYAMGLDPYEGDCVVFVHRSRRSVKAIGGNGCGVWVVLRRFEGGALREMFPFLENPAFVSATHAELAMLLEGTTVEVKARVTPWRKNEQGDIRQQVMLPDFSHEQKIEEKTKRHREASQRSSGGILQGAGLGEGSYLQP